MIETVQDEARRLTELLTRQRDLYRQLKELAGAQRQAIDAEHPEGLLRILGDRQRRINELAEIDAQLEPFRARWDRLREALSADQRLHVSELLEDVRELLGEILRQDEGDCDRLEKQTASSRNQAAAVSVGQKVNAAYAASQPGSARFIDREDVEGGSR